MRNSAALEFLLYFSSQRFSLQIATDVAFILGVANRKSRLISHEIPLVLKGALG